MELWTIVAFYAFEYFNQSKDFSCYMNKNSWAFTVTRKNLDPDTAIFFYPWDPTDKKNQFYSATKIINGKKDIYGYRVDFTNTNLLLKMLSQIQYPFLKDIQSWQLKFKWKVCHLELIEKSNHPSRIERHFVLGGGMEDF